MTTPDPFRDPPADPYVFGPAVDLEDQEPGAPPVQGPLERAVRGDIDALNLTSSIARSMAELTYNLARKLDSGAGMATAAVAKELRDTLIQMREEAGDDDGSALLDRLSRPDGLPTAVGDTPPA